MNTKTNIKTFNNVIEDMMNVYTLTHGDYDGFNETEIYVEDTSEWHHAGKIVVSIHKKGTKLWMSSQFAPLGNKEYYRELAEGKSILEYEDGLSEEEIDEIYDERPNGYFCVSWATYPILSTIRHDVIVNIEDMLNKANGIIKRENNRQTI